MQEGWYLEKESLEYILKLIKEYKIKTILEIGLGHGVSAVEFGKVCKYVLSIEKNEERIKIAEKNIKLAELKNVQILTGDAKEVLDSIKEKFDLIFIDATKREYLAYFKKSLKLANKLIVADNTTSHAEKMQDFLEEVKKYKYEELKIGKGLIIVYL